MEAKAFVIFLYLQLDLKFKIMGHSFTTQLNSLNSYWAAHAVYIVTSNYLERMVRMQSPTILNKSKLTKRTVIWP